MSYAAPFAGLKVIDLSQGVAGPYCGMLLAQHGANVIKVEPVGEGDWARTIGKRYGGHTAYSIPSNLGKRSIALDLKADRGKQVLWRLLSGADVLIEGFRPGVLDRLGFGYDAVSRREPRVLYLSVSGFGQTGPLSDRPAMDPVLQAFTGLMLDNKGEDGIPHRVPFVLIDMSTGLYAFQALSAVPWASFVPCIWVDVRLPSIDFRAAENRWRARCRRMKCLRLSVSRARSSWVANSSTSSSGQAMSAFPVSATVITAWPACRSASTTGSGKFSFA